MLKCLEFGAQGTTNAHHLYFTLFIEFSISGLSFILIFSFHLRCKKKYYIPLKRHWQVLNWDITRTRFYRFGFGLFKFFNGFNYGL